MANYLTRKEKYIEIKKNCNEIVNKGKVLSSFIPRVSPCLPNICFTSLGICENIGRWLFVKKVVEVTDAYPVDPMYNIKDVLCVSKTGGTKGNAIIKYLHAFAF